ncbi:MAG: ATP-dependent zinc metalloprotease FtsH [Lachnospiraceae bacterium]|nr:ATP-dependent zinc metalloprotease FtsH [Lachnospiraceae bacterium]
MDINNGNRKDDGNKKGNRQTRNGIIICIIAAIFMLIWWRVLSHSIEDGTTKEITYDQFVSYLANGAVEKVEIFSDSGKIVVTPKEQKINNYTVTYYTGILEDGNALQARCEAAGVSYTRISDDGKSAILATVLEFVIMFGGLFLFLFLMYRMASRNAGGIMGVGKSNAKVYVEKQTGVTFKDVAGQDEAKESLTELVDFLHDPGKYTEIGAKLPKGAILVGPPGTGKTLLAKAVAGEAKVPFFSLSGSDFVEMYVGVGASRVRDLFRQAQAAAPCIIFIDEVDAIGKSRDNRYGGNDEREQTLNQLLSEMDGFDTSKGIVILAATNRPEVLDKALLRPGRFDRRIIVDRPDLKGREEVLKVHANRVNMGSDVDLHEIALATSGAVGSDLANMINEAAILAVKRGRKYVIQADLFESVEVVIAGKEKKDRILSREEKEVVAYHETGHALVTALQKHAEPVQKITIVPRTKGTLGYVLQAPEEEKFLMKKEEILSRIVTFCAGRAAEEIVFNSITTGASNDIEQATSLARSMITRYGMSEKFGLVQLEDVENRYLDGRSVSMCAPSTEAEIDVEVRQLIGECYEKSKELLNENRAILDRIAGILLEKESITGKEFMEVYNEMKGIAPEDETASETGSVTADEI